MNRVTLPYVMVVALAIGLLTVVPAASARDDVLQSVIDMSAPMVQVSPKNLYSADSIKVFEEEVKHARQAGIPLSVQIVQIPSTLPPLNGASRSEQASGLSQERTQSFADSLLRQKPVESSEGADDGVLMLIVVPRTHREGTTVAFATGSNTFPLNNVRPDDFDEAITRMTSLFKEGRVSDGILSGLYYINYQNLFGPPVQRTQSTLLNDLKRAINVPGAALTLGACAALVGFCVFAMRRHRGTGTTAADMDNPYIVAALQHGRVDHQVTTSALTALVQRGALRWKADGDTLIVAEPNAATWPFERAVIACLAAEAVDGVLSPSAMRQLANVTKPARAVLEREMIDRGLVDPASRVWTWRIVSGCLTLLTLLALLIVPAIRSMSDAIVLAIVIGVIVATAVVRWATTMSALTSTGQAALSAWNPSRFTPADQQIARSTDALDHVATNPDASSSSANRIRALRGLGAI